MKFTVSSAELLKALLDVSKAIPAKSVQPILENFLFVLKDNILEITASDSDLTLRTCIEVEKVQEEGSIAVPARHFTELLKALPDQPVSIKTIDEGASFECSWSSGVSTLPFFPAEVGNNPQGDLLEIDDFMTPLAGSLIMNEGDCIN